MKTSKIKKLCTVIMAATLAISTLAGCGSSSTTSSSSSSSEAGGKELVFNLGADPKTIDPALNQAVDGGTLIENMFEGLYKLDENEKAVPGIAESYDLSADGTEYTFHLRSDAKWSNGDPVKASDFEYAWKRVLDPNTAAEYAYQMMYLKGAQAYNEGKATADEVGVKAVDDTTLKVTLTSPCAYFLDLTSFPCYFPVNQSVVEAHPSDWTENPETYVSNGAYKLTSYKIKDGCTLEKNDAYYAKDDVKMEKVDVKFVTQDTSAWANLKNGTFDASDLIPTSEVQNGVKDGCVTIYPEFGNYYYTINVSEVAKEIDPNAAQVLSDVRVRKALNLAIDRQSIVDNITKGEQIPATAFIPNGLTNEKGEDFNNKEYFPAKGDVDQAKQLLAEAGYPDGQGFPSIVLLINPEGAHSAIGQAIQDMWKTNLGIDIQIQSQEWKVFQKTRTTHKFEIARNGWVGDYLDPMTFLDLLQTKSGLNDGVYSSEKFDSLVDQAKAETDATKRWDLLRQAQDQLMEDMPVIPVYYSTRPAGVNKNVKGLRRSKLGFYFFAGVTKENTK